MKNWIAIFFLLTGINAYSQSENISALKVVQEQLDAYNERDIDRFIKVFHKDVVFIEFANGDTSMTGIETARKRFSDYFEASPHLQSNLAGRIVIGNTVIDHEKITGSRGKDGIYELVVIYEVKDNKIIRVTTIRKG